MNAIAKIDDVPTAVEGWRDDLSRVMASDVDPNKFIAAVTTALTMNPDIVRKCSLESIKNACIKAAYDGLRPDGKEGALVAYGAEAQWMPMVYGVRKKARDHDGIIITARVVYEKDGFEIVFGDEEKLVHEPAPVDVDPGRVIASYAIFKKGDEVLHREVMRKKDIEDVRNASKSKNSPAWSNWFGEMAKKAAVNRGAKSVPMSDAVLQVIQRDNDHYDLEGAARRQPENTLASRFSGAATRDGFSADNLRQIENNSQQPMETIDPSTGEVIENTGAQRGTAAKQTAAASEGDKPTASAKPTESSAGGRGEPSNRDDRAQSNSSGNSRSSSSPTADDSASGQSDGSASSQPGLSRSVFEEFSGALARVQSEENVEKAKNGFFKGKGMRPTEKETELFKQIQQAHVDRVKSGLDVGKVMNDVRAWIEADVPEDVL